jgi:hypothetical protein
MHLKFQSLDFYLIYLDGSVYQPDNLKDKLDTDDGEVHCALLTLTNSVLSNVSNLAGYARLRR